ncbi:hypothetical protein [Rhodohalobacter sp. 8-1]|uniref:hypothetical protein n=1 Tax=Rhodohalobacter sp. 8-1 TaxID=3131972 RepID=UPI0030EE0BE9
MNKLQSVLIINEDTFLALAQNKILSNTNYLLMIHSADSYSEVCESISDIKPDYILLDVALEKKNVLNNALTKMFRGERVPVISISGNKKPYQRHGKEGHTQVIYFINSTSKSLLSEILTKPNDFNLSLS